MNKSNILFYKKWGLVLFSCLTPFFSFYGFILIAVGLGIIFGLYSDNYIIDKTTEVLSTLFINFLKLISLPIIFLSITSTISGMEGFTEMRSLGKKVLKYTLITTILAATVALILFIILSPPLISEEFTIREPVTDGNLSTYFTFLISIVPPNLVGAFHSSNVLGIVFIALIFSISILALPSDTRATLHNLFSSLFAALRKMTEFALYFMPFAVWAFVTVFIKDVIKTGDGINELLLYFLCIVGANVIQGVIILPIILKIKGISPIKTFKGMAQALLVAFFSKSSQATLPTALQCAQEKLKISKRVSNFSFPLCTSINMNGCAAFILITVLYVGMSNGLTFSTPEMIGWIFIATMAAIGNAGVPMGCFFLSSSLLATMNVPLYLLGAILPLYTIIDMEETVLNVWSDSCVTAIVDKELSHKK